MKVITHDHIMASWQEKLRNSRLLERHRIALQPTYAPKTGVVMQMAMHWSEFVAALKGSAAS